MQSCKPFGTMERLKLLVPPHVSSFFTLSLLFLTAAVLVLGRRPRTRSRKLRELVTAAVQRASGSGRDGGRRGLSVQVTERAVAHRALVQHSASFLDRPTGAVPSTILTRGRHHNIHSAPYGPYWRALRRNMAAGVLHPSRLRLLGDTRARALGSLVRALGSSGAAPAGESLHFAVYSVIAEMCFGEDVVVASELLGEARLRAMHKFQRDFLLALPSFGVLVRYPRIGKFLYPSRWRALVDLRRRQEESFLPLVDEVRKKMKQKAGRGGDESTFTSYVESLLDLRVRDEDGDDDRAVTDGELVSLISEFLGGTESTAASLEWTMAELVKHPEVQQKLRHEVDSIVSSSSGGEHGVIPEAELSRMPYLRAVVLESLRRHPPVPFVLRHVESNDAAAAALGVPGRLPAGGATVNFLVGKINRDAAAWSDAASFAPERFMPGGDGEGVDLTCTRGELRMMPFGAGRRVCPGLAAGMLHLEYFVANLVREFEWWELEGDEVDLAEFRGFFFTVMKRPLRTRLVPRRGT